MANEFTNGEQRRIEDIAQEQLRRDVTIELGAFANRVSSPATGVTPPQSPIIQSETVTLGGSGGSVLLPETKNPETQAETQATSGIPVTTTGNVNGQPSSWIALCQTEPEPL